MMCLLTVAGVIFSICATSVMLNTAGYFFNNSSILTTSAIKSYYKQQIRYYSKYNTKIVNVNNKFVVDVFYSNIFVLQDLNFVVDVLKLLCLAVFVADTRRRR